MIERYAVRSVTPVLYAIGCVPVFVGVLIALVLFESNIWLAELTGLYYVGDLVAALAMLLFGGLAFGFLGQVILRLERLREPTVLDHLRHCALLYLGLLLSGFVLLASHESQAGGLGYAYGLAIFIIGAYAASIDALILLLKRHSNRAAHGGAR